MRNGKHQIYVFHVPITGYIGDRQGLASDKDLNILANHWCSHEGYIESDMGVTSAWKHELYNEKFGTDNWEVVYMGGFDNTQAAADQIKVLRGSG